MKYLILFIAISYIVIGCAESPINPTQENNHDNQMNAPQKTMEYHGKCPRCDVNEDGIVDLFDLVLVGSHFGEEIDVAKVVLVEDSINLQKDYFGDMEILGEVKNVGTATAIFVKVEATLKDEDGKVIDVSWTYATGEEGLVPGESRGFEVSSDVKFDEVDSYSLKLIWRED